MATKRTTKKTPAETEIDYYHQLINPVCNNAYRFESGVLPVNGYLIVGDKDGKAVLNQFSESVMPHTQAINWYKEHKISVVRVFTEGNVIMLSKLKEQLNDKPIRVCMSKLERELLKE